MERKELSIDDVKELFNRYSQPIYIGEASERNQINEPIIQTNYLHNLLNTARLATLCVANNMEGGRNDLFDIAYTLELADKLIPHLQMEFIDTLAEKLNIENEK